MVEVKVGLGTCGISAGGYSVFDELKIEKDKKNIDFELKETGCMGMCYREVLVEINDDNGKWIYAEVDKAKVKKDQAALEKAHNLGIKLAQSIKG